MFKTVSALTVALAAASSASALELSVSSAPTEGLPGYTNYTLTLSGAGELNAMTFEASGEFNQNAFSGVFFDAASPAIKAVFPEIDQQDTYFLFNQSSALIVTSGEDGTSLRGDLAFQDNKSAGFALAQLVAPTGSDVFVFLQGGVGNDANTVIFDGNIVPEPASAALLALGGLAALRRRA
ncbi:MAG: PEP-CTERM sorting domain-containing protein [Phycisphaeraceae bacterium]